MIRVLDIPVCESRRKAGKSAFGSSSQNIDSPREKKSSEVLPRRSHRKCFQEKPLSGSLTRPYRKPTLVGELNILRRLRELGRRNSAN